MTATTIPNQATSRESRRFDRHETSDFTARLRAIPARTPRTPRLSVSIIMPVFNEVQTLDEFHKRLSAVLNRPETVGWRTAPRWEAVYVDDGSTDGSSDLLDHLAANESNIVVVHLRRNFGQTAALAAGMDHAKGEIIVTMDCDLQHEPEEIPRLLEKIDEGHDVVLGYRANRRDGLFRRIPSRCANWLMRRTSGVAVRDFGSTFKALRKDVLGEFEMFGEVHRFLPVLGAMAGLDMAEVPITNAPRRAGQSKYGLGRTFGVLIDILTLGFFSTWLTRPGRPWGYLAMLTGGFGLSIQATLVVLYVFGVIPNILDRPGWLLLSVLMYVTGLQCLGFGVMSELLGRTYFASRKKRIYSVRSIVGQDERRPERSGIARRPTRTATARARTIVEPADTRLTSQIGVP